MTAHQAETRLSRSASFARIAAAYAVALAVAAGWLGWGPSAPWLWLDTLVADVLATLVVFGASRLHHNSSFYDAYWSVVPPLVVLFWWSAAGTRGDAARFGVMTVVVVVWAVRLTANWARTFPGLHHEDWRYPMLRERAGRLEAVVDLLAIHVFPTLQVYLALVPAYVVATTPRAFGVLDVVATLVGVGAVTLEATADLQMHRFVATRQPGQVMDRGLWGWSRHPNYVGELGFWVSVAVFGLAASPGDWWWLFLGAAAMLAMFLGASIPMMEERSLARRPDYQDVIDRVPRFFPRPPRRAS